MESSINKNFDSFADDTRSSRLLSIRDRLYYDHEQLTSDEKAALKTRKQPPVVSNRIQPKINFLIGALPKTDPKAVPRTPEHQQDSEAITDALRYVADNTDLDQVSEEVFRNEIIEGYGGGIIEYDPKRDEIHVRHGDWDRLYYDAHSRRPDFKDAGFMGVAVWKDLGDIVREFDVKEEDISAAIQSYDDEAFKDTPENARWVDKHRNRAMVCEEYYLKDGEWRQVFFIHGHTFSDEPSPYLNEFDEPENPIEMQSAYVNRNGERYGVVRGYIDVQDEINKRRSKGMHILNSNQTIGEEGAVEDINKFKREKAKPDGHMVVNPGQADKIKFLDQTADMNAHFNMAQEAKAEIDSVGVNAAMAGKAGDSQSGRAIQARQEGGITELGPIYSQHTGWKRRVYRQIWNRVRQFWTEEKWVRITDDDKGVKFAALNQPITAMMKIQEHADANPEEVIPEEFLADPRLNQVVEIRNNVSELDVDIILEETPDVANIQQEEFQTIAGLMQYSRGEISLYDLIELSTLRGKDKILERRDNPQLAEQANKQVQLEEAERMSKVEVNKSTAVKNIADAANTEVETIAQQLETQILSQPGMAESAKVTASF